MLDCSVAIYMMITVRNIRVLLSNNVSLLRRRVCGLEGGMAENDCKV